MVPRMDHPRSRGEYSSSSGTRQSIFGSSPLSRGIQLVQRYTPIDLRIIPALAGNTCASRHAKTRNTDHPRSRGEYGARGDERSTYFGSSPLSRGIPNRRRPRSVGAGIIPALAGNTPHTWKPPSPPTDHPRSRGEYPDGRTFRLGFKGSSPLSRGIHIGPSLMFGPAGIIPALAGNTCASAVTAVVSRDHPRSRGEYQHQRHQA